jgi:hypothetical protein
MRHQQDIVRLTLGALFVTLCVGCALPASEGDDETTDPRHDELVAGNGVSLNGVSLNGVSLNGVSLNGVSLNGVSLNGVSLNGVSLNGVSLNGSMLTSQSPGGTLSGSQLIGSVFSGPLADGTQGKFKITDLDIIEGDVHLYTVYWKAQNAGWKPACGTVNGEVVRAVPLQGSWNYADGVAGGGSKINDPNTITLACEHYALAKCVEFGYKPWAKVGATSLANHHQACTRMLRADYCGNGHSWTVDGTPINFYDAKGIQNDEADWSFEAEWNTSGATCLSHQRIQNMAVVPECSFDKKPIKCGNPVSWNKALLASEAQ